MSERIEKLRDMARDTPDLMLRASRLFEACEQYDADLAAELATIARLRANAEKQGAYTLNVLNDRAEAQAANRGYAVALAKAQQELAAERAAHELTRQERNKIAMQTRSEWMEKCRAETTKREQAEAQRDSALENYTLEHERCTVETAKREQAEAQLKLSQEMHARAAARADTAKAQLAMALEDKSYSEKREDDADKRTAMALAQIERMRIATWDGTGPKPACWRECERLRAQVERLRGLLYAGIIKAQKCCNYSGAMVIMGQIKQALADTAPAAPTPAQESAK